MITKEKCIFSQLRMLTLVLIKSIQFVTSLGIGPSDLTSSTILSRNMSYQISILRFLGSPYLLVNNGREREFCGYDTFEI